MSSIRNAKIAIIVVAGLLALAALACDVVPALTPVSEWTPEALTRAPAPSATAQGDALAVPSATATRGLPAAAATATREIEVTSMPPTDEPIEAQSAAEPTADPHLFYIGEDDIASAVAGGATAQGGLAVSGLTVRFTGERMHIEAESLQYGALRISDLKVVGSLVASDGKLQLVTESVSPGGLIGAFVPPAANQALAAYTSQWYVEEVHVLEGQLEIRVR